MRSRPRRQRRTRARPATLDGVQALSHPFPHPAPSWWRIEMRACASPGPAGKKIPVAGCCSTQREGRARHSRAETHPPSRNDRLAPSSGPGRKATTRVASTIFFCLRGTLSRERLTRKRDRGKSKSRMMARRAGSRWIAAARRSWALSGGRIQPTSLTVSPSTLLANAHASQTGRFRVSRPPFSRALSMSDVTPKEGTVAVTIVDPVTAKEGRLIHARIGASVLDVAQVCVPLPQSSLANVASIG